MIFTRCHLTCHVCSFAGGILEFYGTVIPPLDPRISTHLFRVVLSNCQPFIGRLLPLLSMSTFMHSALSEPCAFMRKQQLTHISQGSFFVLWASPHKGKPLTKPRLSLWIVEAIIVAYNDRGLEPLWSHSMREMASSWVLFHRILVDDTCEAVSWTSPHTFTRFYKPDIPTAPPLSHAVFIRCGFRDIRLGIQISSIGVVQQFSVL